MAPEDDRYKGESGLVWSIRIKSKCSLMMSPIMTEIPPRYHSAFVLDDASTVKGTGGSFGYPATLFKVLN